MLGDNNFHKNLLVPCKHEPTVDNRYGVHFEFNDLCNRLLEVQANQLSQDLQPKIKRKPIRFPSLSQIPKNYQKPQEAVQTKPKRLHPLAKNILFSTFDESNNRTTTSIMRKSNSISPAKQRFSLENSKSNKKLHSKLLTEKPIKRKRASTHISLKC
ncbi:unnamed protein product [Blepharisma stoltei]|uniref:Uncharacterized protein n=1 Tax=Blepharisma stoltei TaxID=1481888 RepID=A0AAU9J6P5_9CILI|nr:unnamed protein product [Blepharisma stoltei]